MDQVRRKQCSFEYIYYPKAEAIILQIRFSEP
jgi:glutamine phosphoribosylpyrophosphate amidotransferase